ncbi:MAG: dihydrofolate reductase [Gammaproteobacteria bacterium]|nr:dihydrofolate reductase [Gammaproteobacteria bacterium]
MAVLSLIAAMDRNRLIGRDNQLPWHLSADLQRFKALTLHKPIVMGRKTHESIGKPLPQRDNIVVSRNPDFQAAGCQMASSLEDALQSAKEAEEIMLIGGAQLYAQALPLASRLYLTIIDHEFVGDAWFPAWHAQDWQEIASEQHQSLERPWSYRFITLQRLMN